MFPVQIDENVDFSVRFDGNESCLLHQNIEFSLWIQYLENVINFHTDLAFNSRNCWTFTNFSAIQRECWTFTSWPLSSCFFPTHTHKCHSIHLMTARSPDPQSANLSTQPDCVRCCRPIAQCTSIIYYSVLRLGAVNKQCAAINIQQCSSLVVTQTTDFAKHCHSVSLYSMGHKKMSSINLRSPTMLTLTIKSKS